MSDFEQFRRHGMREVLKRNIARREDMVVFAEERLATAKKLTLAPEFQARAEERLENAKQRVDEAKQELADFKAAGKVS